MSAVRINITLPEDVIELLKDHAGPREQSSFIAESVRMRSKQLKKENLILELKSQYEEASNEALEISREFEHTLTDGIDHEDF
jgi:predicted nucleic acid-binding protein